MNKSIIVQNELKKNYSKLWKKLPRNVKFCLLYEKYINNDFNSLKSCWNKIFINYDLKWIDEWNLIEWFNDNDLIILKSFLEFYKYFIELGSSLFPKFKTWDGGLFSDIKFLANTLQIIKMIDEIWYEIDIMFQFNKLNWNKDKIDSEIKFLWQQIFNQIVLISSKPSFVFSNWKLENKKEKLMIDWNSTLYYSKHKISKNQKKSLKLNGQDILLKNTLYWISIDFWKSIYHFDNIPNNHKISKNNIYESITLNSNEFLFKKMNLIAHNFSLFYDYNDNKLNNKIRFMKKNKLKKQIDWTFLSNEKLNRNFSNSFQSSISNNDNNYDNEFDILTFENIGCSKKDLKKRGENWNLEIPFLNRGNSISIKLKEIDTISNSSNKFYDKNNWFSKNSDYEKYIIKQFLNDIEYLNSINHNDNNDNNEKDFKITDCDKFFFYGLKPKNINLKEFYDKIYHKCKEFKVSNPLNHFETGTKLNYIINNSYEKMITISDWEKNFMKII